MEFDLHTHTSQGSACSRMVIEDLVQAACEKKLDGVCITDHDYCWDERELAKLMRASGIQVYGGVELSTAFGEILIYGVHQSLLHLRDNLPKLVQLVRDLGGVMIAAHPLRSDFLFSTLTREERGLDPINLEEIGRRPLFSFVHTFEVCNGRSSWQEIRAARQLSLLLNKKGTGGSDAHSKLSVGSCVTIFEEPVQNEAHLITQLRQGCFKAKKKEESRNVLGM
ncbi:putative metal-dependent phosphoesterase, PHP family [Desulfosporosinus acidiphilus SJ4]|uniref:Putative metal-dependent phosphoesterase, PHP family n=1 Tax=Desulfosporosinus acidiphilus (strain DSM 22704 / JCM 16185 / SJ4) TaxID=646529 RepID=I4D2S3_DESAJ|nr:PHP domain-containing protein [Desulfosporosinus acidiphilus]AFM40097.1 putative metal-dependent phosphoesterase, PHP family [Desulfosporosinus acidiphilus SJ4]